MTDDAEQTVAPEESKLLAMTVELRVPMIRPQNIPVTKSHMIDVWNAIVKPALTVGEDELSNEMRILMGVIRAVYDALPSDEEHDRLVELAKAARDVQAEEAASNGD